GKDYTISSVAATDAGVYHVLATNSIVTGLTLERNPITLNVAANACGVPQSERDALMAFYNATGGTSWTNSANWGTTASVCDWYGITVTDGTVTQINLSDNNLSGTIPEVFDDLTNLTRLNLYLNALTGALPTSIGSLTKLEYLILSNNQLTSIPSSIGNLQSLNTLYASDNLFSGSIPSEIGTLSSLVELSLHFNQFTGSIPTSFGGLTGLYFLHLNDNQLSGTFPSGLTTLSHLRGFKFHDNKFVFRDFEDEHTALGTNLSSFYVYSPQDKVDQEEIVNLTAGDNYTLTTSLSSPNNSYQWYKDGVAISGATGKDYTISSVAATDAGVYHVLATNSIVTGLTLERNPIILNVSLALTQYCYEGIYENGDAVHPNGGTITYYDQNGTEHIMSGITIEDGIVSIMSSSVPTKTGVGVVNCPVEIVVDSSGNCSSPPDFTTNSQSVYVDSASIPLSDGYIVYQDSALTTPFNGGGNTFISNYAQSNETFSISSSGVISSLSVCANNAPIANAGSDASITLPTNSFTLDGSQSYDSDGTIVSYSWTKISGGIAVFNDATAVSTQVTSLQEGTYVFQLTVTDDDGLTDTDTITVTVNPGISLSNVCFSGSSVIVESQNKIENNLSLSMKDGSTISFIDATIVAGFFGDTEVSLNQSFNSKGDAIFNTTVMGQSFPFSAFRIEYAINSSSGIYESSETIYSYDWVQPSTTASFQCNTDNMPPIANAGADGSIVLPTNTFTLDGSQSYDPDGTIVSYLWTKVNGGTVLFNDANAVSPEISSLEEGTYVFELTVTDNNGAIASDTITIIVNQIDYDNAFCTSKIEIPTVANLTPNGANILWYANETDIEPLPTDYDLTEETELGGVTYWWDDINDGNTTRTPVTVYIDENTPKGEEYQEFTIGENATVASLKAEGTNIQWFESVNSNIPLDITTSLVDGKIYYAEDFGVSSCRLAVEVFVGTLPPKGDGVQFVCPSSTIANLVIESLPPTSGVNWYLSETGGATIPETTPLVDGTTYYVSHVDNGNESEERKAISVSFYNVNPPFIPYSTQKFYRDEDHTIANLLAIGNNVQWYSQQTGGNLYSINTELQDGAIYYAQQTTNQGCISERLPITVDILEEPKPTIISCEKFKPQLGGHYVISGWVKEQGATATTGETKNFSEVSNDFVKLLNHLKDRFLNDDKFKFNIPSVYVPKSDTENLNLDALVPFVINQDVGVYNLTVYNFTRIEDSYGRAIGFQFSLNSQDGAPIFKYETPEIKVSSCNTCLDPQTIYDNHPLLGRGADILNFISAQFSNGILNVTQSFIPVNTVIVPNPNPIVSVTTPIFFESITYSDYNETPNYQVPNYENAVIEVSCIGTDNQTVGNIFSFSPEGAIIDGWQRIIGEFTIPADANLLNIDLKSKVQNVGVNIYFDDIRVQPFKSNIKTFVYHPETQRLMSELDENNYATFYEYDLEGGLVRVKKETEKGVYTIQETRSGNVKASN
ncbi:PKD domain-containing protein, partial [Tenacibaculum sp.]|uniref:PKD domain-containing protein n=1 Tax=Tenacibaculum sp. TaxID=1906242 RepID=UPI003D12A754